MSDTITVGEKTYVTSKLAASQTSYTQDYVGQLARAGLIDGQRVGGLWYIDLESLKGHQAGSKDPNEPRESKSRDTAESESLLSLDGNDYVSASRASEISGYNQDYVGQLARSGKLLSRRIGNRWYVHREGLIEHKREKDALLAGVQREAVGIDEIGQSARSQFLVQNTSASDLPEPLYNYTSGGGPLYPEFTPRLRPLNPVESQDDGDTANTVVEPILADRNRNEDIGSDKERIDSNSTFAVPIRVIPTAKKLDHRVPVKPVKSAVSMPGKSISYATFSMLALTVILVLSFGLYTLGGHVSYASAKSLKPSVIVAAVGHVIDGLGANLEKAISPELVYKRVN